MIAKIYNYDLKPNFKMNDNLNYKDYLTVSDISTFLFCPRKLFLSKVYGIKPKPTKIATYGSFAHQLIQRFGELEDKIAMLIMPGDDLNKIKLKVYNLFNKEKESIIHNNNLNEEKEFLNKITINETIFFSDIFYKFLQNNQIFGDKLREMILPKVYGEYPIVQNDLKLRGRIDRILDFKDFKVVVEYKSSNKPIKIWDSQRIQLGSYILMMNYKSKKTFNEGFIIYLGDYSRVKISLNDSLKNKIINLSNEIRSLISMRKIPPKLENTNKCKVCNYKDYCMRI